MTAEEDWTLPMKPSSRMSVLTSIRTEWTLAAGLVCRLRVSSSVSSCTAQVDGNTTASSSSNPTGSSWASHHQPALMNRLMIFSSSLFSISNGPPGNHCVLSKTDAFTMIPVSGLVLVLKTIFSFFFFRNPITIRTFSFVELVAPESCMSP